MRSWSFAKGHGTQNDFVIVLDSESELEISPGDVAWLCDRRAGIGGDGLLRAVRARHIPEWSGDPDLWFMDYRNADGSLAQMCGNGVRVFVQFLIEQGLVDQFLVDQGVIDQGAAEPPLVPVATRAGLRPAELLTDGRIRVGMGPVQVSDDPVVITDADQRTYAGTAVDVGNPHAVGFTDDLASAPLALPPDVEPTAMFPDGVNVELVQVLGDRHIAMRVHERGSGETRSCGTGTVAAAAATERAYGDGQHGPVVYRVDVPGGRVEVELGEQAYLTGPAVIVAYGTVELPDAVAVGADEES